MIIKSISNRHRFDVDLMPSTSNRHQFDFIIISDWEYYMNIVENSFFSISNNKYFITININLQKY